MFRRVVEPNANQGMGQPAMATAALFFSARASSRSRAI
jgi:hypothetical protein